jgi:hypothetical protein
MQADLHSGTISHTVAQKRINAQGGAWAINVLAYSIVYPFLPIYRDHRLTTLLCFTLLFFLLVSQFVSTLSIYSTKIVGISRTSLGFLYTIKRGFGDRLSDF